VYITNNGRCDLLNYTRFEQLCRENGTNPTALTQKLGLSKGNTSTWKRGGNPSADIIIKLADELNCSIDYLYDRSDQPTVISKSTFALKDEEAELLGNYFKLDESGKLLVKAKIIEELRRLEK